MYGCKFHIGQIINIIDDIDYTIINSGTIKLIEEDNEIEGLYFLYICANDQDLNTVYDPRIGYFWRLIESNSINILDNFNNLE